MKNILITTSTFEYLSDSQISSLRDQHLQVMFNPFKRKLTEEEVVSLFEKYDPVGMIAGVEPLTSRALQKTRNLKVISRCGVGLDSVDLEAARNFGIVVTNTPDAPTIPVAELTIGLILCVLRQIHVTDSGIRQAKWVRPMGSLLHGKTVGIFGCGRIGTCVAKLLSGFECRTLGYDITNKDDNIYYTKVSIEELFNQSDILTLHLSYSPESHHIINQGKLQLMKKGAILINAARGGLVNEEALYEALKSGHLGGAAVDSFEEEPYTGPLRELSNVLLTAHIGSYAKEARMMMEKQAWENLLDELKKWR